MSYIFEIPSIFKANRLSGRLFLFQAEHPALFITCVVVLAAFLFLSLQGWLHPAYADFVQDTLKTIGMTDWPKNIYNAGADRLKECGCDNLTNNFQSLLGDNSSAYTAIQSLNNTIVKPIAVSILAITFLMGCFNIANKFEANGALAPFKEVVFLLLGAAICIYVVNLSLDFCQSIFDMFASMSSSVLTGSGLTAMGADNLTVQGYDDALGEIDDWACKFFASLIFYFFCIIMEIVCYFAICGRAVQALIYGMLSPIAIAFFGNEHTRSWSVGFAKSFIAIGLAGVIMAAMLVLMPLAFSAVSGKSGALYLELAVFAVFIKGMTSAGSWAKEILGG
jgi:hypothetical protein